MSTNPNTQIQIADNANLAAALGGLNNILFNSAEENLRMALGDDYNQYTALEQRAMVATEALRLTAGMDLASIITKGDIIAQIEREGLQAVHPNGYADLTTLSKDNGVSVSELSDIRAMHDVIFPYITNVLQLNLASVWDAVGKSTFREMVPALRSLISGQRAAHASVREAVTNMLNNAAATLATEHNVSASEIPADVVRRQAVTTLLNDGATSTNRQMRRQVRPSGVPAIEMATLQTDDSRWYAVMQFQTQEQRDLALRIMNPHVNNMNLDARSDEHRNIRRSLGSIFGD